MSARFVLNIVLNAEHDKLGDPLETNPVKSLWDEIHVTRMSFPAVNRLASPITFWSSYIVVVISDGSDTRNWIFGGYPELTGFGGYPEKAAKMGLKAS